MRTGSSHNFSIDELPEISAFCKQNSIQSHLTLNTILYDEDLETAKEISDAAVLAGIDSIIVADISLLPYLQNKKIKVHISSLLNVSNTETLKFISSYSDLVVLPRELTLQQIKNINRIIKDQNIIGRTGNPIQTEIFIHGAFCMAVTGKCYLSMYTNNEPATRGECVQNCRRSYILKDAKTELELERDDEFLLSSKDLCTIGFLDQVTDSGVAVLKIEGRAKSADYVYAVTRCYREAMDSIVSGTFTKDKIEIWNKKLSEVFNRGFWDGYYLGKKTGEFCDSYGSQSSKIKIYIGKGIKYYEKAKAGLFLLENDSLQTGDTLLIIGPSSGIREMIINEMRIDDISVNKVEKGKHFTLLVDSVIRESDKLYRLVDRVKLTPDGKN